MNQPETNAIANQGEDSQALGDAWKDFETRSTAERKRHYASSPRKIGSLLADLVRSRGYAQISVSEIQEKAWQTVVGTELATVTQFAKLSRGTMQVVVANSLVMQELTFRKEQLLAGLQTALPDAGVKQLRFKVGRVTHRSEP
ncbi:DUF721 domain-containing protein [Bythopirellula goksoeyrii]|uniref:Zn-ribbon-containing, possibly RNA-binding protein and truncated derivatives n=1 Tax=Bythopirellula goksoeyrii TaxID=1400387 RepID=A0A5B9Q1B7_9BACT|nr:DUF721 domain-containing protein [Bythopirellula goksoeyrii]QEG32744.1 hypothetical protein Pr1d_00030 [Bythopirellula goksoeyrii]